MGVNIIQTIGFRYFFQVKHLKCAKVMKSIGLEFVTAAKSEVLLENK